MEANNINVPPKGEKEKNGYIKADEEERGYTAS